MIRIKDLIAAEEAVEAAERELKNFQSDPQQWRAFETLDEQRKKTLNFQRGHLEHRQVLIDNIRGEQQRLVALRKAFAEGGL